MAVAKIVSGKGAALFAGTLCLWAACFSWLGAHPLSQSYLLFDGEESEVKFLWLVDLEEAASLAQFPRATFHQGRKEQAEFVSSLGKSFSEYLVVAVEGKRLEVEPSGWRVTDEGFLELSLRCPGAGSPAVLEVSHTLQNLFGHPHQLVVHSGRSPGSAEYVIPPGGEGTGPVSIPIRVESEAGPVGQMLGEGLRQLAHHLDLVLMLVAAGLFLGLSHLRLIGVAGGLLLVLAAVWWWGRFPDIAWIEFAAPLGLAYLSVEFLLWGPSRAFHFGALTVVWLILEAAHGGYVLMGVRSASTGSALFWLTAGLLVMAQFVCWGLVGIASRRAPDSVRPKIKGFVIALLAVVGGIYAAAGLLG